LENAHLRLKKHQKRCNSKTDCWGSTCVSFGTSGCPCQWEQPSLKIASKLFKNDRHDTESLFLQIFGGLGFQIHFEGKLLIPSLPP
jgi:hypothetical protein